MPAPARSAGTISKRAGAVLLVIHRPASAAQRRPADREIRPEPRSPPPSPWTTTSGSRASVSSSDSSGPLCRLPWSWGKTPGTIASVSSHPCPTRDPPPGGRGRVDTAPDGTP